MISRWATPVASLLIAGSFGLACKEGSKSRGVDDEAKPAKVSPEDPAKKGPQRNAKAASKEVITLGGRPFVEFRRREAEREFALDLLQSSKNAKLRIQHDRVKLQIDGQTVAKVKAKERGCKIYRGDEAMTMRVKYSRERFKLLDAQNNEIGFIHDNGSGNIDGSAIEVQEVDGRRVVKRDGQQVASVSKQGQPLSAAFLALSRLSPEERVAAYIFAREWL